MLYKLGDICSKIGSGATPRGGKESYCSTGISLVRSQNILDFKFSSEGLAFINQEQASKLSSVEVLANDVLLNITGDSVARACLMNPAFLPARVNQHVAIIRGNNNYVLNSYLLYFLQWKKPYLLQLASAGGTRSALTKGMIEQLDIDLPPLYQQEKIVAVLGSLDEKIDINNKINENLEQQILAIYQHMFINKPSHLWKKGQISDLGTVVGGSTPSKANHDYFTECGIAWITPKDLSINKTKFIAHGESDITELGLKNSSAKLMPKGTVLFSSRAPIGYIAIATGDVTTNQGFKSIVPNPEVGSCFIYCFLKTNLDVIESMASGTTFKEISGSTMKKIPAFIPDNESLSNFNHLCEPILTQQLTLELQNKSLSQIRDSLLPKLLSGEIKVS